MVLFWLLIGLKFREFWYINLYVLKKKVFYLYRVWACDVMKSLQWNEAYTKKVYDGFWNFRTQANIFQWKIFSYNFLLIVMNCDLSIIGPPPHATPAMPDHARPSPTVPDRARPSPTNYLPCPTIKNKTRLTAKGCRNQTRIYKSST